MLVWHSQTFFLIGIWVWTHHIDLIMVQLIWAGGRFAYACNWIDILLAQTYPNQVYGLLSELCPGWLFHPQISCGGLFLEWLPRHGFRVSVSVRLSFWSCPVTFLEIMPCPVYSLPLIIIQANQEVCSPLSSALKWSKGFPAESGFSKMIWNFTSSTGSASSFSSHV